MPKYVDSTCKPDVLLDDAMAQASTALDEGADEVGAFQESASKVFHSHATAHGFGLPEYVFLVESLLVEPGIHPYFSAHAYEDAGADIHALFAELARCALRDAIPVALDHDVEAVVQIERPISRDGHFAPDAYLQTLTDATRTRVRTRECEPAASRHDDDIAAGVQAVIRSVRPSWEHLPPVEKALLIETAVEAAGDCSPVPSEQLSALDGPTPPAFDEFLMNTLWFSMARALTAATSTLDSSSSGDRPDR